MRRNVKFIAVTIDDGPNQHGTVRYLQLAKKYDIAFTFFVIGKHVLDYGNQIGDMIDAGCEIGNHSMQHPHMEDMYIEDILDEFADADDTILSAADDAKISFLRAPYLEYNEEMYQNLDRPLIGASIVEQGKDAENTYNKLMNAEDGDIVLLHSWNEASLHALEKAIPNLMRMGFEFVTVSDLFAIRKIDPVCGRLYNALRLPSNRVAAESSNVLGSASQSAISNPRANLGNAQQVSSSKAATSHAVNMGHMQQANSNRVENYRTAQPMAAGYGINQNSVQNSNLGARNMQIKAPNQMNTQNGYAAGNVGSNKNMNQTGYNQSNIRNGHKKRKHRFLRKLLIFVLLIAALYFGGIYAVTGMAYKKMNYEKVEAFTAASPTSNGVTNILLIGNDAREGVSGSRSDAMILLSISDKTKKIQMTSFLRDSFVDIPGHGQNRLNAAFSFGGAELLMKTITANFGIEVNRYMIVDFNAFVGIVDAVGGVELDLTNEEVKLVNGYLWEYNIINKLPEGTDYLDETLSGKIKLDGAQALAYTRNRYIGSDFGRTERQRKVINAVIEKLPGALITNGDGVLKNMCTNIETNMTQGDCYQLAIKAPFLLKYEKVSESVPIEGSWSDARINKMAVLKVDFEKNKAFLRQTIYGE